MADYLKTLRARIGPRPALIAYTTALITDDAGRVLLQQRGDFDLWGLPGGALELDEDLPACAEREAAEETGLRVRATRLVGLWSGPAFTVTYPNGDVAQQWTATYACTVTGGHPRADGVEGRAVRWFDPAHLPPTTPWYTAMLATRHAPAPFFEPPRSPLPVISGDYALTLRRAFGAGPLIFPGSSALITDEAGRVLLIQRADNGLWSLPAGMQELGESAAETIVREVAEEVGLRVQPRRLVGVYSGADYHFTYLNGDEVQVASALFACDMLGGTLRLQTSEIRAAGFFAPTHLPHPMMPRTRHRLHEWFSDNPSPR